MTAREIIDIYISFFEKRGHKQIANSPLVPENDPTTLFTSSGKQPLVPYLLGEPHPQGTRLVDVQNCFRAVDIEEVGDNRHTTFFRMLGNWSLGDYFKSEEIPWLWEFLTVELGLPKEKLYITVFAGDRDFKQYKNGLHQILGPDVESVSIWKQLLENEGMDAKDLELGNNSFASNLGMQDARIFYYDASKNWWSRSGTPANMPIGEPGGPDTEIFYDFGTEHDKAYGENCHPNCECGKFLEIANAVFMEYRKIDDRTLEELPKKNVDFGGGLERLLATVEDQADIFKTSLYSEAIQSLENLTKTNLDYKSNPKPYRIIVDHLIASIFMVSDGIVPSNKGQGYILRRLIRRSMVQARKLGMKGDEWLSNVSPIIETRTNVDGSLKMDTAEINYIITQEVDKFRKTIDEGLKEIKKMFNRVFGGIDPDNLPKGMKISNNKYRIDGREVFNIYETYGLPIEIAQEIMTDWGVAFDEETIKEAKKAHQEISRAGAIQKFAGGLADTSELTIKGHTATHLLHQALRDIFGDKLHQSGSNITSERVRFDFNHDKMLSEGELKKIEEIVRGKIKKNLPVLFKIMPLAKAKEIGAIGIFDEKYQTQVKVYFIGDYSKELCGGPHVDFTGAIKSFRIIKQENLGKGYKRIYAKVE